MGLCDICSSTGIGTFIGAEDLRRAVFKNGFNPFKLGLVRGPNAEKSRAMGVSNEAMYQSWKGRLAQDASDWNICPTCMAALRPHLEGTPHATGVTLGAVLTNPLLVAMEAAGVVSTNPLLTNLEAALAEQTTLGGTRGRPMSIWRRLFGGGPARLPLVLEATHSEVAALSAPAPAEPLPKHSSHGTLTGRGLSRFLIGDIPDFCLIGAPLEAKRATRVGSWVKTNQALAAAAALRIEDQDHYEQLQAKLDAKTRTILIPDLRASDILGRSEAPRSFLNLAILAMQQTLGLVPAHWDAHSTVFKIDQFKVCSPVAFLFLFLRRDAPDDVIKRFRRPPPSVQVAPPANHTDPFPNKTLSFSSKTKQCVQCGAELSTQSLTCSACGCDKFIWV